MKWLDKNPCDMFFTQKLSLKFRPGLTKERVDLHEIAHYRSNVILNSDQYLSKMAVTVLHLKAILKHQPPKQL